MFNASEEPELSQPAESQHAEVATFGIPTATISTAPQKLLPFLLLKSAVQSPHHSVIRFYAST